MKNKIKINYLKKENIKNFLNFIKNNHSKNHIFVKSLKVLNWFYKKKSKLNFVIASKNNKILGVQGFIPLSKFDLNLDNSTFLAYWRVKPSKNIGVGFKIFKFLSKSWKFLGVVGINEKLIEYHKWQGFKTGRLNHHYFINKNFNKPKIINIKSEKVKFINKKISIYEINTITIKKFVKSNLFKDQYPKKSKAYILNRYLKNPFYEYKVFLVKIKNCQLLFVIRLIELKNTRVIKLIDFIGNKKNIIFCGSFFENILNKFDAEYLDFYSYGIEEKYLIKAGFKNRYDDKMIIPDHFEPFENKNIDINFAFKFKSEKIYKKYFKKVRFCKGDGDMDRPSKIN